MIAIQEEMRKLEIEYLEWINISLNEQDQKSLSPCRSYVATYNKSVEQQVRFLVSNNIDLKTQDKYGHTALHSAVLRNLQYLSKLLIRVTILKNSSEEKPDFIKDKAEFSTYWDQTRAQYFDELSALRTIIFNDESLFDFYHSQDSNMLASMSRNEQMGAMITSQEFKDKYTHYVYIDFKKILKQG